MRYPPLPCKPLVLALTLACAVGAFSSVARAAPDPAPAAQRVATALVKNTVPAAETQALRRALREETVNHDVTLARDLVIKDAGGQTLLTLPAGTVIGRDKSITRFSAAGQVVRRDARFKDVALNQAVAVADPRSGERLDLPAGTIVRLRRQQRFDPAGNLTREGVDLRAALPDGSLMRIRDRSEAEPATREWAQPTTSGDRPLRLVRS